MLRDFIEDFLLSAASALALIGLFSAFLEWRML